MTNICYTYRHYRLDTNEVFYVGVGTNSKTYKKEFGRAYSTKHRSHFWKSVVKKAGYRVEIIETGLTKDAACAKEVEMITFYGRRDLGKGSLVNMTDGGEGLSGHIFSESHKNKISNSLKGRSFTSDTIAAMSKSAKNKIVSEGHRKNISKGLLGNKYCLGYKHSEETKRKVSLSGIGRQPMLGKKHSDETKKLLSEKMTGRIISPETCLKMSLARKGQIGPTKGRKMGPMSQERKDAISKGKLKARLANA